MPKQWERRIEGVRSRGLFMLVLVAILLGLVGMHHLTSDSASADSVSARAAITGSVTRNTATVGHDGAAARAGGSAVRATLVGLGSHNPDSSDPGDTCPYPAAIACMLALIMFVSLWLLAPRRGRWVQAMTRFVDRWAKPVRPQWRTAMSLNQLCLSRT